MLPKPKYINIAGNLLDLSVPKVMGVINVSPDSFYKGSRFFEEKEIVNTALEMIEQGAAIIDVGGNSSRPGAEDVAPDVEKKRVLDAIKIGRAHV